MEGAGRMSHVLTVSNLCLTRGARQILRGVHVEMARGEVVALMGLSGSGKTTVLRAIADLEPEGREAVRMTETPDAQTRRRLRCGAGMVFQFHCLFEHLTVMDNVCLAPVHVHGVSTSDARARASALLDELEVGHRAQAYPRELSGGEAQRVAIARALATDPPLLLLDEPTASLDPPRRASLGAVVRQLASSGRAILLTSHDVDFVRDFATRVLILAEGVVVEEGAPAQVFDCPAHEATQTLLRSPRNAEG
jgi:ABC-type polar amino acid transport system ATPase subunit